MSFGFSVFSETDGSLLVSTDALNALYLGKASASYRNAPAAGSFGDRYVWELFMLTPPSTTIPMFFYTLPTGQSLKLNNATLSGNQWLLEFYGTTSTYPEIYCFAPSSVFSSVSGDYGLQLRNSSNSVVFDSRWNAKLLTCARSESTTIGNGATISCAGITKPAIMYSSKYVYIPSALYYLHVWFLFASISGSSVVWSLVDSYRKLYSTGIPGGYTGTWGAGELATIPVIDGAYYD